VSQPSRVPLRTPNDPDASDAPQCSIAGTLDALGDLWSILVLRELFFGVHRFNDMLTDLGISRSVLTNRLNRLVDLGVVRTAPYQEPGDRVRHEYRLTRKGVGLLPVLVSLMQWGDENLNDGTGPFTLHDRESGDRVHVELRTVGGELVEPHQMRVHNTARRR
jgi:DNA-binding HxlR family transcriptional regulator